MVMAVQSEELIVNYFNFTLYLLSLLHFRNQIFARKEISDNDDQKANVQKGQSASFWEGAVAVRDGPQGVQSLLLRW